MSDPKSIWGNPLWDTIHILAASLKDGNGEHLIAFLNSLTYLLPCEKCQNNLRYKLNKHPPTPYMTDPRNALYYTYMLHDMVNESINQEYGKKIKISPPFEQVQAKYMDIAQKNCKECKV